MSSTRSLRALLVAGAVALVISAVAVAAPTQTYQQAFTSHAPGKSTGMMFSASASNPSGTLTVQAKTVKIIFPAGTKLNTAALARCTKVTACPAKTKIGTGKATVMVNATPITIAVTAYNKAGGMVLSVASPPDPRSSSRRSCTAPR